MPLGQVKMAVTRNETEEAFEHQESLSSNSAFSKVLPQSRNKLANIQSHIDEEEKQVETSPTPVRSLHEVKSESSLEENELLLPKPNVLNP